jgi:hypothetical protein
MKHVFISYVHEDSEMVKNLSYHLTSKGVNVWLDRNNILPGVRWKDAIREAIQEGNFFIACFSQAYSSRDKTYMNEELTLAIEGLRQFSAHRAWFIPVLLSDCKIPNIDIGAGKTLNDIQAVFLYKNWDDGIQRILEVVQPIAPEEIRWQKILAEHKQRPYKPRCVMCGETYGVDNIYICSVCGVDYCFHCVWELEKIEDDTMNRWKCPCGGELR